MTSSVAGADPTAREGTVELDELLRRVESDRPRGVVRRRRLLLLLSLVLGGAVAGAVLAQVRTIDRAVEQRLVTATDDALTVLDARLTAVSSTTLAVRGLVAASDTVSQVEFSRYTAALTGERPLGERFVGLEVLAVTRDDGTIVLATPNDTATNRRIAATLALPTLDTAMAEATDLALPLLVVPAEGGMLVMLTATYVDPTATAPTASTALRRSSLDGWIVAVVSTSGVVEELGTTSSPITYGLATIGGEPIDGRSGPGDPSTRSVVLNSHGAALRLEVTPTGDLRTATERRTPLVVLALGLLVAASMTGLAWTITTQRERALVLVDDATAALVDRAERLEEFAGVVAHDLKNPLAVVQGMASILRTRLEQAEDPVLRDIADRVVAGTHRMNRLIEDILQYAEAGAEPVTMEPIELRAAIEDVLDVLSAARRTEDTIELDVPRDLTVTGDPTGVRRILANTIGNALKYRREGQPVHLEIVCRPDDGRVQVAIADDGIGIPAGQHRAVLQPFSRADTTREGSGLGLAICSRIVAHHGGSLELTPSARGGTTVRFDLPAA